MAALDVVCPSCCVPRQLVIQGMMLSDPVFGVLISILHCCGPLILCQKHTPDTHGMVRGFYFHPSTVHLHWEHMCSTSCAYRTHSNGLVGRSRCFLGWFESEAEHVGRGGREKHVRQCRHVCAHVSGRERASARGCVRVLACVCVCV